MNMRFDNNTSRVLDMNKDSYLPNLRRALQFRTRINEDDANKENLLLSIIENNANFWFDFRKSDWNTITFATLAEITFPLIKYDKSEKDTYINLEPAHIYNFSIGTYGIKRALNYLNHGFYSEKLFYLQVLSENSEMYRQVQNEHFRGQPIKIIRFKVQSYHKAQAFNADGYRGYVIYLPVTAYDPKNPSRFQVEGHQRIENLDESDYYFKNTIKAWFCCCKTGQRCVGACSHIIAAMIGFGCPGDFSKARYLPLTADVFSQL